MTSSAVVLSFLVILVLVEKVTSAPSELSNYSEKNNNLGPNDVQDSHLERVRVKQETGFDGKVRSIRFSVDTERNKKYDDKQRKVRDNDPSKLQVSDSIFEKNTQSFPSFNSGVHPERSFDHRPVNLFLPMVTDEERSSKNYQTELAPSVKTRSLRMKRLVGKNPTENDVEDLQAEEAKIFRPLFVYRQQVAKRLRLQNDNKYPNYNRRRVQRTKFTNSNNYPTRYYSPFDNRFYF